MLRKYIVRILWCFCVLDVIFVQGDKEIKEDVPSKIQQKKMIDAGRELCAFLKDVVSTEAQESENAVRKDVEVMIQNGIKQLNLEEENFILRVSCNSNNVKSRGFVEMAHQLARDAEAALGECAVEAIEQASIVAGRIRTNAENLERKGQEIMDAFLECSRKGSWSMFACYKKTVGANISPMKEFVTDTVKAHSGAHTDFLTLRTNAAACIQGKLGDFRTRIEAVYTSNKN